MIYINQQHPIILVHPDKYSSMGNGIMTESRRSGNDRRQQYVSSPVRGKRGKDRRSLLKDFDTNFQMYNRVPMFYGLSEEQITGMLRICAKKKHVGKQQLFKIGDDSNTMSILLEGELGMKFFSGVKWQTITPPATVGEMGFFSGHNRCASVVAETDCKVLNINNTEFFKLIGSNKDLGNGIYLNVIRDLSDKLRNANEKIDELYGGLFNAITPEMPSQSGTISGCVDSA